MFALFFLLFSPFLFSSIKQHSYSAAINSKCDLFSSLYTKKKVLEELLVLQNDLYDKLKVKDNESLSHFLFGFAKVK